jgi:nuclear transport factor 2 (NTF2) superfamily protein
VAEAMTNTIPIPRKRSPSEDRPPLPPFTYEDAVRKVRLAEDAWNSRDPQKAVLGYSMDSRWRNRSEFATGRAATFTGNRIAVRFAYEWRDDSGNWCRSYGNENWPDDDPSLSDLGL